MGYKRKPESEVKATRSRTSKLRWAGLTAEQRIAATQLARSKRWAKKEVKQ